ncbi:unnamed protein product [Toxocara canis]|uniref:Uncharacterized protein n=1 Tax=Toxocara canis TaxID=6265 RepID=A0A183UX98_TOXCA|nr:unnamed protein product [Toxocara canis]
MAAASAAPRVAAALNPSKVTGELGAIAARSPRSRIHGAIVQACFDWQEKNRAEETLPLDESLTVEDIKPVLTSTPIHSPDNESTRDVSTTQPSYPSSPPASTPVPLVVQTRDSRGMLVSALNVLFSFLLLALFVIAVLVAIFESHSSLLGSSPTVEMLRHSYYEPLRGYIVSLYERFAHR